MQLVLQQNNEKRSRGTSVKWWKWDWDVPSA